jgi:hypothetical protein
MLNAIKEAGVGSEPRVDEDAWPEETTAVIPAEQLAFLRDVMDFEDHPTARFAPVRDELLASGSGSLTALPQAAVCGEVSVSPRAMERSVTIAPAAEKHRAWLIAMGLVLLAIEVLALSW